MSKSIYHNIRVAILIGELNKYCGPSSNTIRLAKAFIKMGIPIWIVYQNFPDKSDLDLVQEFDEILLQLPPVHPLSPSLWLNFWRHMKKKRFSIVHFNLPTHALCLAPQAKLFGAKTIYTMRNLLNYNADWIARGLKLIGRQFIDQFVAVSSNVANDITKNCLSSIPPKIIYNGIEFPSEENLKIWKKQIRKQIGIKEKDIVIGTAGRLVPDKKQQCLLEALLLLKKLGHRFYFLVVGDGPSRENLENFCKENGLKEVIFVGFQKNIYSFLSSMDIFVFHSSPISEGLPTVVIEAAACKLPMVLVDLPCTREVFNECTGILFAQFNQSQEFAKCIDDLLHQPWRWNAIGEISKSVVERKFSIENMAQNYLDLYYKIQFSHAVK